jgi:serine/threonine protein kinase
VRTQIGSYRIEAEIASGGMGIVYLAWDEVLGRRVVIKTFRRDLLFSAELRERFMREGKAHAQLQHPNIVTIHAMETLEDELFIVMEYLEGKTLDAVLTALPDGRMMLDDALRLFEQILDAIEYVHGKGIVHRDLKPLNVMVCDGRPKVIDFGIALLAGMPRLTSSAKRIGTPGYMSPEQLEGKDVDRRSDLYSAALVLYRMLTGNDPFVAKEYVAQMYERLAGPRDLKSIVPDVPPGVCAAIATAMSHDPANRFGSSIEFREALRDGAEGFLHVVPPEPEVRPEDEEPPPPPPNAPQPKTPMWVYAVGAASVLVGTLPLWRSPKLALPQQPRTVVQVNRPPVINQEGLLPPPKPLIRTVKNDPPIEPHVLKPPEETEAQRAERRRRELDELHREIEASFPLIEADIRVEDFRSATHRLDDVASRAQLHAGDLPHEIAEIERLRDAVRNGEADKNRHAQQEALWDSRVNDIESAVRAGEFGEAQGTAKRYLAYPDIPAPIDARMRQLQRQALEAMRGPWQTTTVSTTTNTVRKPSSPPRK